MMDPRLEDHATGLELQIVELVERRERARVQGRMGDAEEAQRQIDALQMELAETAERAVAASGQASFRDPWAVPQAS